MFRRESAVWHFVLDQDPLLFVTYSLTMFDACTFRLFEEILSPMFVISKDVEGQICNGHQSSRGACKHFSNTSQTEMNCQFNPPTNPSTQAEPA